MTGNIAKRSGDSTPAEQQGMSPDEWDLRVRLADYYHVLSHLGWDETIFNHSSVRVPGPDLHFLINPMGLLYNEVTASNLVKVDRHGTPVDQPEGQINYAGFIIHGAIHEARPDVHCISHIHSIESVAVSMLEEGLCWDNLYAAQMYDDVAYHDFEGIALNPGERPRIVSALGSKNALIFRNHGVLTCGGTLGEAFYRLYLLQRAFMSQLAVGSRPVTRVPEEVLRRCHAQVDALGADGGPTGWDRMGQSILDALVRKINEQNVSQ